MARNLEWHKVCYSSSDSGSVQALRPKNAGNPLPTKLEVAMSNRPLLRQTLSVRAAVAVCIIAAVLGWLAVLGVIYAGHVVSGYIASSSRGGGSLPEIAPAGGRDTERR